MEQKSGSPGSISNSVLTYATTNWADAGYKNPYKFYGEGGAAGNDWESSAFFFSNKKIPLTFDWEISLKAEQSALNYVVGKHGAVTNATQAGLSRYALATQLNGPFVAQVFNREGDTVANNLRTVVMNNGFVSGSYLSDRAIARPSGPPFFYAITYQYSASKDTITYITNGVSASISNVKTKLGGDTSAYLVFGGRIQWKNASNRSTDWHPENIYGKLTFNSIKLPHFSPAIKEIKVYDSDNGDKEIKSPIP